MRHDRKITITTGPSRKATQWLPQAMLLSELWDRLRTPARGTETLADYLALPKGKQDDLKDVGGFVAGTLNGTRRKQGNVTGRDIVTLDLDSIPNGGTDDVLRRVNGLGCGFCVYSTRKHHPTAPRLRVLIPLDRTVTPDEYEPIARRLAEWIGLEFADPSTFEPGRLMYWPSCCADSVYVFVYEDKPFCCADGMLATFADWRDVTTWPALPGQKQFTRLAAKQGDPESKKGIVGAFCRCYDVRRAMDELLPGVYAQTDTDPNRYTFVEGSTTGGAVVYEDGKFLYSHHATDPCGGKLVNAWDLVRLHRFADADDAAEPGTPTSRLPSFKAMCEAAGELQEVRALIAREDFEAMAAATATEGAGAGTDTPALEWTAQLELSATGGYQKTLNNTMLILQNAPDLHGCARFDDFTARMFAADGLPWRDGPGFWSDSDTTELRRHLEQRYHFRPSKQDVQDAVQAVATRQAFHPVRDYLAALEWDGVRRLDTVFADYLGALDTPYTRAVSRKALVGAVARIMAPGCKYDYMPVLVGGQGRDKSSMIRLLSPDPEWFSDSVQTFDGARAFEAVTGKWLIEVAEMHAFDKITMNMAKAFISKQSDFYRAAYAKFPTDRPRQCVFFGTTNNRDCLRDETGNRRYWPVDIDEQARKKSVHDDLPNERDQLWAEAVVRWRIGEPLYLSKEIAAQALAAQEDHRERHPLEDTIRNFLDAQIPAGWDDWDIAARRTFWAGDAIHTDDLVPRERVCVREIWQEAIGNSLQTLDQRRSREIVGVLLSLGWKRCGPARFGREYGVQKAFKRRA